VSCSCSWPGTQLRDSNPAGRGHDQRNLAASRHAWEAALHEVIACCIGHHSGHCSELLNLLGEGRNPFSKNLEVVLI
jgi:hypothetical protein